METDASASVELGQCQREDRRVVMEGMAVVFMRSQTVRLTRCFTCDISRCSGEVAVVTGVARERRELEGKMRLCRFLWGRWCGDWSLMARSYPLQMC